MTPIGLFYGSTDGNTAQVAAMIQSKLDAILAGAEGMAGASCVELFDLADFYLEEAMAFDLLIFGVPTWNAGQLQRDWERAFEEFDTLELAGKLVALFGLGDQMGYPDTFVDALCFVADKVQGCGGTIVGRWPAQGYTFRTSWACEEGMFPGLVLDVHNQPELTERRLDTWLTQVLAAFNLAYLRH